MNDLLLFGLLFAAAGIGWFAGWRGYGASVSGDPQRQHSSQYYQGLNYVLDGRPDEAIDAFITALDVNDETLETHITLGNLLRRRGEVNRAIRIHQNLLGRPTLPQSQVHQAHLELAKDYIAAGLLDRAERLLLDLVKESPEQRRNSQHYLLEIYQSERDWPRAIDVATELLPRKKHRDVGSSPDDGRWQPVHIALAHCCCEQAVDSQAKGELTEAGVLLDQALAYDSHCVRASIMQGELACRQGDYLRAVQALRQVQQQDPEFIHETIPTLRECYQQLGDEAALRSYLNACLDRGASAPLVLAVAEELYLARGSEEAAAFLTERLSGQPSLRGLKRLIALQIETSERGAREGLEQLKVVVERLIEERPAYRCEVCGFSGRHLHWHCPGCKRWGTMKAVLTGIPER